MKGPLEVSVAQHKEPRSLGQTKQLTSFRQLDKIDLILAVQATVNCITPVYNSNTEFKWTSG